MSSTNEPQTEEQKLWYWRGYAAGVDSLGDRLNGIIQRVFGVMPGDGLKPVHPNPSDTYERLTYAPGFVEFVTGAPRVDPYAGIRCTKVCPPIPPGLCNREEGHSGSCKPVPPPSGSEKLSGECVACGSRCEGNVCALCSQDG